MVAGKEVLENLGLPYLQMWVAVAVAAVLRGAEVQVPGVLKVEVAEVGDPQFRLNKSCFNSRRHKWLTRRKIPYRKAIK